jgi:hypothetical protein
MDRSPNAASAWKRMEVQERLMDRSPNAASAWKRKSGLACVLVESFLA